MKDSRICFVVLTYHPDKKRIASLLQSLARQNVIIVDNTPNSDRKKYVSTDIVFTNENLGYTGGMNRGIEECLRLGAQWVTILNDDMVLSTKGIKTFVQALTRLSPGIAGIEGGMLDKKRWTTILSPAITNPQYISGSFMAIHRNVLDRIGLLYEPYFIYYEDVELSIRAKQAGFPIHVIASTGIRHREGGHQRKHHTYYLPRNHLLFVQRNAPAMVKLHEYVRLPKTIWEHWQGRDEGLHGIKDYFLRRFGKIGGS